MREQRGAIKDGRDYGGGRVDCVWALPRSRCGSLWSYRDRGHFPAPDCPMLEAVLSGPR
jgi:hypothetical protein